MATLFWFPFPVQSGRHDAMWCVTVGVMEMSVSLSTLLHDAEPKCFKRHFLVEQKQPCLPCALQGSCRWKAMNSEFSSQQGHLLGELCLRRPGYCRMRAIFHLLSNVCSERTPSKVWKLCNTTNLTSFYFPDKNPSEFSRMYYKHSLLFHEFLAWRSLVSSTTRRCILLKPLSTSAQKPLTHQWRDSWTLAGYPKVIPLCICEDLPRYCEKQWGRAVE